MERGMKVFPPIEPTTWVLNNPTSSKVQTLDLQPEMQVIFQSRNGSPPPATHASDRYWGVNPKPKP
jgi:hypothetical protein